MIVKCHNQINVDDIFVCENEHENRMKVPYSECAPLWLLKHFNHNLYLHFISYFLRFCNQTNAPLSNASIYDAYAIRWRMKIKITLQDCVQNWGENKESSAWI